MAAVHAMLASGASPMQVFFNAVWPSVQPEFAGNRLYVWDSNCAIPPCSASYFQRIAHRPAYRMAAALRHAA